MCRILQYILPYTPIYQTVQAQSTQICGSQVRLVLNTCLDLLGHLQDSHFKSSEVLHTLVIIINKINIQNILV